MKRFIEGECRTQLTLIPECLEDYIGPDNPVRVVDAFVDALDLAEMGFDTVAAATVEAQKLKDFYLISSF